MDSRVEDGVDTLCECLSWTDLEQEEIVVTPNSIEEVWIRGKNCLLVKLLSMKYFNRKAYKATMKNVWKPIKPLRFHEMGAGMMLAEFEDPNDKNRVVRDGPWNFDKCLILVKNFDGCQQVKHIRMETALF